MVRVLHTIPCIEEWFSVDSELLASLNPWYYSVQFSSVAQSCLTLCNPIDCNTPDLPVHHQLSEFTQTNVHWVGDAIQPSHPLSSLSSSCLQSFPASGSFQMSQFFTAGGQSIRVSASVLPMNIQDWSPLGWTGWISFKSLLQHHSSKASILQCSAFFMVQLTSIHDCWKNHRFDYIDLCR